MRPHLGKHYSLRIDWLKAAGEYVSVSSQADTEKADLGGQQRELEASPEFERRELVQVYVRWGLESSLATQVAEQLMNHDALAAHARDELGISEISAARPIQAAAASALTFAAGAGGANILVSVSRVTLGRLSPNAEFQDVVNLTSEIAGDLHGVGSAEQRAVNNGWAAAGLQVTGAPSDSVIPDDPIEEPPRGCNPFARLLARFRS